MTPFELRILKIVGGKVRDTINHMLVEEILPRIGKKAERVLEDRLTVTEDRIRRLEKAVEKLQSVQDKNASNDKKLKEMVERVMGIDKLYPVPTPLPPRETE